MELDTSLSSVYGYYNITCIEKYHQHTGTTISYNYYNLLQEEENNNLKIIE